MQIPAESSTNMDINQRLLKAIVIGAECNVPYNLAPDK